MDNKLTRMDNISQYQKINKNSILIVFDDKYFADYGMFSILEENYLNQYDIAKKSEIKKHIRKILVDLKNNINVNYPLRIKLGFLKDGCNVEVMGD